MDEILIDAVNRINKSSLQLSEVIHQHSFELNKLLLAIQGNEAITYAEQEEGCETQLRQVYNLCKIAQSIEIEESGQFQILGKEIDLLLKYIRTYFQNQESQK